MRENTLCPGCDSRMSAISECEIEIDCCYTCHGIWLDPGELSALFEAHGSQKELSELSDFAETFFAERSRDDELRCPCCIESMVDTKFGDGQITVCLSCGGMFVDSATLDSLIPRSDNLIARMRPESRRDGAGLATAVFFALAGIVSTG